MGLFEEFNAFLSIYVETKNGDEFWYLSAVKGAGLYGKQLERIVWFPTSRSNCHFPKINWNLLECQYWKRGKAAFELNNRSRKTAREETFTSVVGRRNSLYIISVCASVCLQKLCQSRRKMVHLFWNPSFKTRNRRVATEISQSGSKIEQGLG